MYNKNNNKRRTIMKKILVLILALVMTMSLTACGGGIEEIEITHDNWKDYLEIKNIPVYDDEYDTAYHYTLLCLKDEYADKNIFEGTDLSIDYSALLSHYDYTVEDGEIVVGNLRPENDGFKGGTFKWDDFGVHSMDAVEYIENKCAPVVTFETFGNKDYIVIFDYLEVDVRGTLVLE